LSSASETILHAGLYAMTRELKLLDDDNVNIETVRQVLINELNKQDH